MCFKKVHCDKVTYSVEVGPKAAQIKQFWEFWSYTALKGFDSLNHNLQAVWDILGPGVLNPVATRLKALQSNILGKAMY